MSRGFTLPSACKTRAAVLSSTTAAAPAAPHLRLAAWILDAVIGGVVVGLPAQGLIAALGGWPPENAHRVTYAQAAPLLIGIGAVTLLGMLALVAFDGGRRGATPGKRLLGLRVADSVTLQPIGFRRAALRRIVYLVGGLALYAGWWWVLLNRQHRAWHDLAAGSLVIGAPPTPAA